MKYCQYDTVQVYESKVFTGMARGSKTFEKGKEKGRRDASKQREYQVINRFNILQLYKMASYSQTKQNDFYAGYKEGYEQEKENQRLQELKDKQLLQRQEELREIRRQTQKSQELDLEL